MLVLLLAVLTNIYIRGSSRCEGAFVCADEFDLFTFFPRSSCLLDQGGERSCDLWLLQFDSEAIATVAVRVPPSLSLSLSSRSKSFPLFSLSFALPLVDSIDSLSLYLVSF